MVISSHRISYWIRVVGILITILGLIHCAATPIILTEGFNQLPADLLNVFIYMFAATGLAVAGTGLVVVFGSFSLAQGEDWPFRLITGAAIFISVLGVSAPVAMSDNPFAYITLALALILDLLLIISRRVSSRSSGAGA